MIFNCGYTSLLPAVSLEAIPVVVCGWAQINYNNLLPRAVDVRFLYSYFVVQVANNPNFDLYWHSNTHRASEWTGAWFAPCSRHYTYTSIWLHIGQLGRRRWYGAFSLYLRFIDGVWVGQNASTQKCVSVSTPKTPSNLDGGHNRLIRTQ